MVYVDPYKLLSRQLSPMDVVDAVNSSNLILPAGDVKMGPYDYYVYSNSLVDNMKQLNNIPVRTVGILLGLGERRGQGRGRHTRFSTTSYAWTARGPVYIPIMKQGGNTNTIDVVNGVRR